MASRFGFIEVFDLLNVPVDTVDANNRTSPFSVHESSGHFKNLLELSQFPESRLSSSAVAYLRGPFAVGGSVTTATARVRIPLPGKILHF